jgi:hypothetical protein
LRGRLLYASPFVCRGTRTVMMEPCVALPRQCLFVHLFMGRLQWRRVLVEDRKSDFSV